MIHLSRYDARRLARWSDREQGRRAEPPVRMGRGMMYALLMEATVALAGLALWLAWRWL